MKPYSFEKYIFWLNVQRCVDFIWLNVKMIWHLLYCVFSVIENIKCSFQTKLHYHPMTDAILH